jgi:hypothetical protein
MTARALLPNRRAATTFAVERHGLHYTGTCAYFADGRLAEIFLTNHKTGSMADAAARDAAVTCSLALQYGAPLETIRKALMRDSRGVASSPLGAVLDLLAEREP